MELGWVRQVKLLCRFIHVQNALGLSNCGALIELEVELLTGLIVQFILVYPHLIDR